MHFLDIIGNLGSNQIRRFLHWQEVSLQPLGTSVSSGQQIIEIWSINYALHFGSIKVHKHCLYWTVFSTDVYRKSKLYKLYKSGVYIITCFEHRQCFIWEFFVSSCLAIVPDLEMIQFWCVIHVCLVCILYFLFCT